MDGLDRSRIAELIVDKGLPSARRGSGYRVSSGVVLTAAHVVRDASSVLLRFNSDLDDEWTSDGQVEFADSASDIGVVVLADPAVRSVSPAEFGRVGERAAVIPYEAVGFPRFKLRTDVAVQNATKTSYRDSAHVHGMIASLANWRERTLELMTDPPGGEPDQGHSPWEGMSGAAVWCAGRIVGVVSEHHRRDGLNRLAATPFDKASRQLGLTRWQDLAGLVGLPGDPNRLVDVAPRSMPDTISETYLAQVGDIVPLELLERSVLPTG